MGALTMVILAAGFWKFVSRRAALLFVGLLLLGALNYAARADQSRQCDRRAWFCDIIDLADRIPHPAAIADDAPPRCPDVEPITGRVFVSDAANTELHRLIDAGVCQQDAIERIARGWQAPFDPTYGSWWSGMF